MAKKEKCLSSVEREFELDMLFKLYVARVAKAETINTMRRDCHSIFRDALSEAKVALDVYLKDKQENESHE